MFRRGFFAAALGIICAPFLATRKTARASEQTGLTRADLKVISSCAGPPIGTIVYFDRKYFLPKGWAICDGENGTVDLREREAHKWMLIQRIGLDD